MKLLDERIKDRPFKRIEDCKTVNQSIRFQCNKCLTIWQATPSYISQKGGCPQCASGKNEQNIHSFLTYNNIPFLYHQRLRFIKDHYPNYIVYFYLPQFNLIIEYNGNQHYFPVIFGSISMEKAEIKFEAQTKRDMALEECCKNKNIQLIWIDVRNILVTHLLNISLN